MCPVREQSCRMTGIDAAGRATFTLKAIRRRDADDRACRAGSWMRALFQKLKSDVCKTVLPVGTPISKSALPSP